MLMLIAACSFGSVSLFILGLTMKSEREIVRERIEQQAGSKGGAIAAATASSTETELEAAFKERVMLPSLRWLASIGGQLTPSGATRTIEEKLDTAGRPWDLGAREFAGLKVLSLVVFVLLGIGAAKLIDTTIPLRLVLLGLFFFIGFILPDYVLQVTINDRQSRIRKSLAQIPWTC